LYNKTRICSYLLLYWITEILWDHKFLSLDVGFHKFHCNLKIKEISWSLKIHFRSYYILFLLLSFEIFVLLSYLANNILETRGSPEHASFTWCEKLMDDRRWMTDDKWWQKLTLPLPRWVKKGYIPGCICQIAQQNKYFRPLTFHIRWTMHAQVSL
jgi:hypothetical protein